jgi:hypothetical protein
MGVNPVEYVVPIPGGDRGAVPLMTECRGTWVTSSILALRKRELFVRYTELLAPTDHDPLVYATPSSWMPVDLVMRHYEACDKLDLTVEELLSIGVDVTERVNASSLALGRNVASATGVTPWTILGRLDKGWARIAVGGAVAVAKLGPKEARVEVLGFPFARIYYNRIATRGILRGLLTLVCQTVWVQEIEALCGSRQLAFRIQWV